MTDSANGHPPILAAGGIVLRGKARPRIAVVRLRREKAWVLPKGKLLPREHSRDAAVREVREETGHAASVHEFLGSMSYAVDGGIKIVQFWLMRAADTPTGALSDDVKAVKWLPLKQAIDVLSRAHERVFLSHVGPIALAAAKKSVRAKPKHESRGGKKRRGRNRPIAPAENVIAMERKKAGQNGLAKALGNWTGRATQSMRRAG
jgi:8-oxo-dGTP diphosphatase